MSNRWADDIEEERDEKEYTRTVDEDGVITESYIQESVDEKNNSRRVRITKKFREKTKTSKVHRAVQERAKWAKFGDVAGKPRGPEPNISYQIARPTEIEFLKQKVANEEIKITQKCRKCGGNHWTLKCPFFSGDVVPDQKEPESVPKRPPVSGSLGGPKYRPPVSSDTPKYRPPTGQGYERERREEHTLRVTQISEDTTNTDLEDLFKTFGRTTRVFLAMDKENPYKSRGFAFISYERKEDAQRAMEKLHGHGYGDLILSVEWAKPREEKPGARSEEDATAGMRRVQEAQRRRY